jgi:hypothetical protein
MADPAAAFPHHPRFPSVSGSRSNADLTMLARLAQALSRARAVPLAA